MTRRIPAPALTSAGWLAGLVVTTLVVGTPVLAFGYRSPALHLVLDSFDSFVALLVAFLGYGRLRRSGRLQDLFLMLSLLLLGIAGLATLFLTSLLSVHRSSTLGVWMPLSVRVVAALLIATAAVLGLRAARQARARPLYAVLPSGVVVGALLGLWAVGENLPAAFDPSRPPPSAASSVIVGHPVLLSAQALIAACFVVASIAFTVQASRRDDEFLRWVGPACALGAFARVNYLLFPSLYTDWLYTGDLLRTGCYLLLLAGAGREIRQYWQTQATAAVLEDRRRFARELHDGVIQELTYIRGAALALPVGSTYADSIVDSSERALDEARAAVHALGMAGKEPLGRLLYRAASQVTDRSTTALQVEVDASVTARVEQQHTLMRITREAVANAVRHGQGTRVRVRLHQDQEGRHLVIEDNGRGFDVGAAVRSPSGYGLTSMRDRAEGLPGTLVIEANQGAGSVVRLTW